MYINGAEEESETLIDDDADTCVNLTGSDGCTMDMVWNPFIMFNLNKKTMGRFYGFINRYGGMQNLATKVLKSMVSVINLPAPVYKFSLYRVSIVKFSLILLRHYVESYFVQDPFRSNIDAFQISVRSSWANRQITIEIQTSNVPCSDLSVVWRMTWGDINHSGYTFVDFVLQRKNNVNDQEAIFM